jgi:hypothetical protein
MENALENAYYQLDSLSRKPDLSSEERVKVDDLKERVLNKLPPDFMRQAADTLPQQLTDVVNKDPDKIFVATTTLLNNNEINPESRKTIMAMNNKAKENILNYGGDPQELLKDKNFLQKSWDVVGTVLNFVPNLVMSPISAALTGKWIDPLKSKGGSTLVQNLMNTDPNIKELFRKAYYGEYINPEDQQRLNDLSTGKMMIGLGLDLAIPSVPPVGKLLTSAIKTLKDTQDVGKIAEVIGNDTKVADKILNSGEKAQNIVVNMGRAVTKSKEELPIVLKGIIKNAADTTSNASNKSRLMTILTKETQYGPDLLKDISDARALLQTENLPKISKALDNLENATKSVDKVENFIKPLSIKVGAMVIKQPKTAIGKFFKETGQKIGQIGRKTFISDVPTPAKPIFMGAKRGAEAVSGTGQKNVDTMARGLLKISKVHNVPIQDAARTLRDFIETKALKVPEGVKNPETFTKDMADLTETINKDSFSNFLNDIQNGVKTPKGKFPTPLNVDGTTWQPMAQEYNRLSKVNPHHPMLEPLKTKMYDLFSSGEMGYVPHVLTQEASDWLKANNISLPQVLNQGVMNKIYAGTPGFAKGRSIKDLPISEINKLSQEGKYIKYGDQVFNGKLFEESLPKAFATRYEKSASTIKKISIKNNLLQALDHNETDIISKTPKEGWMNIANFLGTDVPAYVHKDVYKEIIELSKTNEKTLVQNAIGFYDKLLGVIKGELTVGQFPFAFKFFIRNMIGNIFNSFLSKVSIPNLFRSYIDTVKIFNKGTFELITKDGRMLNTESVIKLAREQGIINTGFSATDIGQTLSSKLGKALTINIELGRKLNVYVEDTSKMALFIAKLREGASVEDAAAVVRKYLFDYSDFTRTERTIRHFIPFYAWLKNNIALQAENAFAGQFSKIERSIEDINKQGGVFTQGKDRYATINTAYENDFLKDNRTLLLNKDKKAKLMNLLTISGLLPNYDLMEIFNMFSNPLNAMQNNVSPILKIAFDWVTNPDKRDRYTTYLGLKMPKIWRDVFGLFPTKYLETYNPFGIFGNQQQLSLAGYVNQIPMKNFYDKLAIFLIGSPMNYDEEYNRIIKSRSYKQDLYQNIINLNAEIKRLDYAYKGSVMPKKDLYDALRTFASINKAIQYGYVRELLDQNDKRVTSALLGSGKKIIESFLMYMARASAEKKKKIV